MKKSKFFICSILLIATLSACSSTSVASSDLNKTEVAQLINEEHLRFIATRAYPLDQTVINVLNHLRPQGQAFRLLDLSQGYGFTLNKNEMNIDIPYFGTRYRANLNPDSNSFKFDSKEVTITKKENKKSITFEMVPEDQNDIVSMYLQIFPNGRAFLSINANDRQPISYDGYVTTAK